MNAIPSARRFFACFLLLVWVGPCFAAPPVKPSKAAPKTVVDYFLLLPQQYFEVRLSERSGLLRYCTIDLKHDYLAMPGDGAQASLRIALFRHAGRVLVAVHDRGYDPPDPTLDFLRYERGRWKKVNDEVLPADWDTNSEAAKYRGEIYTLPRYGSAIRVTDVLGEKLGKLIWKNGRFKWVEDKK